MWGLLVREGLSSRSDGANGQVAMKSGRTFKIEAPAGKPVPCELRNPMVPIEKCVLEMGHPGEHSWKT